MAPMTLEICDTAIRLLVNSNLCGGKTTLKQKAILQYYTSSDVFHYTLLHIPYAGRANTCKTRISTSVK